jgi:hypothetical protein
MNKNAMLPVNIENLDMGIAARVAQQYVLQEIYLVDAKISRDPFAVSPENLTLKHKCSAESLTMPDSEKYIVLCNFRVAAINGQRLSKPIMKIEASFCTSYVEKTQPDYDDSPENLLTYVEYVMTINPISDAWPYWREFVQSMSARMGFPALTVPLLEIMPKKSALKETKSQPIKKESARRKKFNA